MLFQVMDPNSKIIKIDFCDVITLELYCKTSSIFFCFEVRSPCVLCFCFDNLAD